MNASGEEAKALLAALGNGMYPTDVRVIVAPPAPYLAWLAADCPDSVSLAAQNCHAQERGAYTGEWSAPMLRSIGVEYVILGHSERRQYFGETDEAIGEKVAAALQAGITPIYCCGELQAIREAGNHLAHVGQQLKEALFGLEAESMSRVVIAYEPVWAIGTGLTASAAEAQEMHAHLRSMVSDQFGPAVAGELPILYGGSVKPGNATELFAAPDVDGGLVGGASLKADDFQAIIHANVG